MRHVPTLDSQLRWCASIFVLLLISGCGGGSGGNASASSASVTPPRAVEQSDLQIAAAIYQGTARTPPGFYSEASSNGHASVATLHVKNTDIDPSLSNTAAEYELCTNDWSQALSWSEINALNSTPYANLVATNDDERFFEFGRVQTGTPELYVQERIYKCAYLNRTAANLRATAGEAGQLNVRPLTGDELRRLSEYFWQFTTYNNFGHVVLKSSSSSTATLEHTLHIASLVRAGISTSCDRIDVIAWRHQVNDTTGALTLTVQPLWSFGVRESAGVAELCLN
jgi:hypothetical protein